MVAVVLKKEQAVKVDLFNEFDQMNPVDKVKQMSILSSNMMWCVCTVDPIEDL